MQGLAIKWVYSAYISICFFIFTSNKNGSDLLVLIFHYCLVQIRPQLRHLSLNGARFPLLFYETSGHNCLLSEIVFVICGRKEFASMLETHENPPARHSPGIITVTVGSSFTKCFAMFNCFLNNARININIGSKVTSNSVTLSSFTSWYLCVCRKLLVWKFRHINFESFEITA
jgi:hypothetical protein